MRRITLASCLIIPLTACVQPYNGPLPAGPPLSTQDQMAQTEEQDRVARFQRLAAENNVVSPTVTTTTLPAGSVDFMRGPVPVVRVVFPEKAFFAFDSATPLPESSGILDVIAENMKHDVPDAALTILGHTDAVGTDGYNVDLSRRRAQAVMDALVARGVPASQLTEVAIGKRQPIAPNDDPAGRALNRRVEFLVSPATSANLAAVQQRVVPASYLQLTKADDVHARVPDTDSAAALEYAMVYGAKPSVGPIRAGIVSTNLTPLGGLKLSPTSQDKVAQALPSDSHAALTQAENVHLAPTMPVAPVRLASIEAVKLHSLGSTDKSY